MTLQLWYSDGPASPRVSPADVLVAAGHAVDADRSLTLGLTIERHAWLDDPALRGRTVLAGYALARAVSDGRLTALPVRISKVPAMITTDPPDVAVVAGVRRGDALAFAGSVGWADVLARTAHRLVVEVDDDAVDLGAPLIEGNVVATVTRPPATVAPPAGSRPADATDLRIGEMVASLLPAEPTLQFGPGGIGEGIAAALEQPVHIWSGLVTDAMASLHAKQLLIDPVIATYTWGGQPIRELAAAGMLSLVSCTVTNDITALTSRARFVGCNTAVQVGLDGAVNVERVGGRQIASIGGHADFCLSASRSKGGLSIIAVRSSAADGTSTIVASVDVVSTPRSDVDVVVTEHGIADLRGLADADRARRLIAIAAPEHRAALGARSR